MAEYMFLRLMIAGSATGLFALVIGVYQELQVAVKAHRAKKKWSYVR